MHFGFSYIGLIFLALLFVPNLIWAKHLPKDYEKYAKNENKVLLVFERVGEVLVSALVLIFSDFNVQGFDFWLLWLVGADGPIAGRRAQATRTDFPSGHASLLCQSGV